MGNPDLIEQRQYAETIMAGLNIRPFRVDISKGLLLVAEERVVVVEKLCKHFGGPFRFRPQKPEVLARGRL